MIDFAIAETDRMAILASQYRQLGLTELARHMTKQVEAARKFASTPTPPKSD